MKQVLKMLMGIVVPTSFLIGCGSASIGKSVQVKLDPDQKTANLELEMGDGLEVSLAGSFPLANGVGELYFTQATRETNAKIGLRVLVSKLIDDKINIISALPSGAPLPAAILPPLFKVPVSKSQEFDLNAVFSLTPELQMGALIGMKVLSTNYMISGVALCQNFRNSENRAFAAACLYGPNPSSSQFGGIFLGGTFGDVIKSNLLAKMSPKDSISPRVMKMSAASEVFEADESFDLPAIEESSSTFDQGIHDPEKKLAGSKGLKMHRNLEKIFRVRR